MPPEPIIKRAVAFVDGQSLFHAAREAFGSSYPNYDIALILSQDQDLSEVAAEIRTLAAEQKRWIKIACAFPVSPTSHNQRGIDKTDWIPIDRATYEACIDRRDYRGTAQRRAET